MLHRAPAAGADDLHHAHASDLARSNDPSEHPLINAPTPPEITDVFPKDDPVARFVVVMAMARNDLAHASILLGEMKDREHPAWRYHARVAQAHAFESVLALERWRKNCADVREFLKLLPGEDLANLKKVARLAHIEGGVEELEATRNSTFHYPYPDPEPDRNHDLYLQAALDPNGPLKGEPAFFDARETSHSDKPYVHNAWAEDVAIALAFREYFPDLERLEEQIDKIRVASAAFAEVADACLLKYAELRGIKLEEFGTLVGRSIDLPIAGGLKANRENSKGG